MNLPLAAATLDSPAATVPVPGAPFAPVPAAPLRPELGPLLAVLLMLGDEQRAAVVHITAATRNEGTSTVAREIAAAVAASGWKNVALIDAHQGNDASANLLDAASRGDDPALTPGTVNGCPVAVGAFSSGYAPAARMDSVRSLYAQLRSTYALTVVDCPPVLPDGGAAVLGSAADGTVLVVEAERTRVGDVHRARELLEGVGTRVLGVVLNKSRSRIPRLIGRFL